MHILRFLLGFVVHLDLVALLGIAAGVVCWRRRRRERLGFWVIALSWIALVVVHLTPAGRWGLTLLEARFPRHGEFPGVLPEEVDGLILLGGSFALDESADRGWPVYNPAAPRLFELFALARRYPRARLVFTGNAPETALARRVFAEHGVEPARVTFDDAALNTRDNARNALKLVKPRPGERWALVTSAVHMPRSVGLFRGAGWDVIPCSINHLTSGKYDLRTWASPLGGLNGYAWRAAVHEWAGLAFHYLAGDSPAWFPAP